MKAAERDALLARLDERSQNTWQTTEKIEKHLKTQNGIIADHTEAIAFNTQGRRSMKWVIGGIIFALVPLFVVLFNAVL